MAKQTIAGIGVSETHAALAVIETDNELMELRHLEEVRAGKSPFWYLALLDGVDKKTAGRMKKIAFSFDSDPVILHPYPVDASLSQNERDEHARWELAQIIPDYSNEHYPSKVLTMQPKVGDSNQDMVAIATDGGKLNALQLELRERKFTIGPVMAGVSAAGRALYRSHPEERNRRPVYIHVGKDMIEIVRYLEGEIVGYHVERSHDVGELFSILQRDIASDPPEILYPYGSGLTNEWIKMLRAEYANQLMPLNPFRRLRIATTVQNFSRFLGKEFRFPCAIGAALSN